MQRARNARAFERLLAFELFTHCDKTGHFGLGNRDFLAAECGLRHVGDFVIGEFSLRSGVHHALLSRSQKKVRERRCGG